MVEDSDDLSENKLEQTTVSFKEGRFIFPPGMTPNRLVGTMSDEGLSFTCGDVSVILQTEEVGSDLYMNILEANTRQLIGYQKVTIRGHEAQDLYKRYTDSENMSRYGTQGLFKYSSSLFFEVLKTKGVSTITGRVRVSNIASIKSRQLVNRLLQPDTYYKSELRDTYSDHEKELVTHLD